jgi:hypothetical protein
LPSCTNTLAIRSSGSPTRPGGGILRSSSHQQLPPTSHLPSPTSHSALSTHQQCAYTHPPASSQPHTRRSSPCPLR